MRHKITLAVTILVLAGIAALTLADEPPVPVQEYVRAESSVAAGRYLVRVAGCNDCHTPGFMEHGETVPESQWLTGVPVGWRGPWGTTYASNLRLFIKPFSEDDFIKVARTRNSRPPMVWPSLHAMSDQDLRSIYRYIKSLGETGVEMPQFVPPDQEPKTPYLSLMPQMPAAKVASAAAQPTTRPIGGGQ
jgi:mono/diheme cytochrome c family protein